MKGDFLLIPLSKRGAGGFRFCLKFLARSVQLAVREFSTVFAGVIGHAMPATPQVVFINDQSVQTDRPPGVGLVRADAELGAETKTITVRKARGRIVKNAGRIDGAHKYIGPAL